MDPELRAALDKLIAADKAHEASADALNAALLDFVNLAASKAKPK
jgi:hypothetical protein